jgi:hypothetical protein
VCVFVHSRFVKNLLIWSWETNPSFLRWFCHIHPSRRRGSPPDPCIFWDEGGDKAVQHPLTWPRRSASSPPPSTKQREQNWTRMRTRWAGGNSRRGWGASRWSAAYAARDLTKGRSTVRQGSWMGALLGRSTTAAHTSHAGGLEPPFVSKEEKHLTKGKKGWECYPVTPHRKIGLQLLKTILYQKFERCEKKLRRISWRASHFLHIKKSFLNKYASLFKVCLWFHVKEDAC